MQSTQGHAIVPDQLQTAEPAVAATARSRSSYLLDAQSAPRENGLPPITHSGNLACLNLGFRPCHRAALSRSPERLGRAREGLNKGAGVDLGPGRDQARARPAWPEFRLVLCRRRNMQHATCSPCWTHPPDCVTVPQYAGLRLSSTAGASVYQTEERDGLERTSLEQVAGAAVGIVEYAPRGRFGPRRA